jgi:hypothetical protein
MPTSSNFSSRKHNYTISRVVHIKIREGQSKEVEIKKESYNAEILQTGKRNVSTVSFIENTDVLEF